MIGLIFKLTLCVRLLLVYKRLQFFFLINAFINVYYNFCDVYHIYGRHKRRKRGAVSIAEHFRLQGIVNHGNSILQAKCIMPRILIHPSNFPQKPPPIFPYSICSKIYIV